jgi:hypothetical protein
MYEEINNLTRLKYVLIAIILFCVGLILMLSFFLIVTLLFALAVWAWAGIFLHLAIIGRPYRDFSASLRWLRS